MIYLCKIFKKITGKKKTKILKATTGVQRLPTHPLFSFLIPSTQHPSIFSFFFPEGYGMSVMLLRKNIKQTNKLDTVPHACAPSTWVAGLDIQRPCLR